MRRYPKETKFGYKSILKGVFIIEAAFFLGGYYFFKKLNNSRDYRKKMSITCPPILESYYKFGELMSSDYKVIRENDEAAWKRELEDKFGHLDKN